MSPDPQPDVHPEVRAFLQKHGATGGRKSRRKINPEQQAAMQAAKRLKRGEKRLAGLPLRVNKPKQGGAQ